MRIEEIYIYGYGKFENIKFTNLGKRQVFFGSNEAGKSTIMSFIHSVLFGFPTKQQSDLRYEPKKGAKYGGQLTVYFSDHGRVTIERVKGKAAGDVVVKLENGKVGGESLLKELLSSIDKHLYTSIFSFNLQGLQNIHLMKEQDLGRFLFSIGTVGTDQLVNAENELTKALDARFKVNGRVPQLNVKMKELQQLRSQLREAEKKNEQYVFLLQKRDEIQLRIKEDKEKIGELNKEKAIWDERKKVFPLYKQAEVLKKELSLYQEMTFPQQGLERLEQLRNLQDRLQRKIHKSQQRLEKLKVEMERLTPNFALIEKEHEINTVVENLPLLDKTKQELTGLQAKVKKLDEEILFLHNKVHLSLSEQDILKTNTSIFIKEKVTDLSAKQKSLAEKKLELDERFQEEKNRLEELESKEMLLKQELLPDEERTKLEDALSRWKSKEYRGFQKDSLEERVTGLKATLQKERKRSSQHKVQHLILAILFSALCGWGFLSQAYSFLVLGGAGLLFIVWSFFKESFSKDIESIQNEIVKLEDKKRTLEQESDIPIGGIEEIRQRLQRDKGIRDQVNQLALMIERQHDQYNHIIDLFQQWEQNEAKLRHELLEMGREFKLPDKIALHYLLDAFGVLDQLKKAYIERKMLMKQIDASENSIKEMISLIEELSLQFFKNSNHSHHEAAFMLKRSLREELEKHIQYKEKGEQYHQLEEEWRADGAEWKSLDEEVDKLYQEAGARDENQFREIGKRAVLKDDLLQKWHNINMQLKLSLIEAKEIDSLEEHTIDKSIEDCEMGIETLEQEIALCNEELASVKHRIALIEEGGTYADLLHRFKQQKFEFQSDAKEWAKFAAAKEILQKTINNFKDSWFPKMLIKAEDYLQFLTGGNYLRILPKQDRSGFMIESKDHLLYEANELSQATTEQIYISIRLSLAVTVYEKYKLPIMIDDSFVNFDAVRTERVIRLLKGLEQYQILFFTCHQHLLKYFEEADIIDMEKEKFVS